MRKKMLIGLILPFFVLLLFAAVSCTKKVMNSETGVNQEETPAVAAAVQPENTETEKTQMEPAPSEEPASTAPESENLAEPAENARLLEEARKKAFLGELVLFDFDSSVLTPTAQERLKRKAQWLTEHPDVAITIEGHCDERGSTSYNLALGERRAQAALNMLEDLGISAERIQTVSYGEERPFSEGHYEGAWSLNRRANFVLR